MATSRRAKWAPAIGVAVVLIALAALLTVFGAGSSKARVTSSGAGPARTGQAVTFSWLHPASAPAGWLKTTTATSDATLFYPPTWKPIPGDAGTVTESLRTPGGLYAGYLNVTPRQGAERLRGWAAFRISHNREDGDRRVTEVAAAEGLRFRNAAGSCVIDDYTSRVGSHSYREIACIVKGNRHTDVFIAAALRHDWRTLRETLQRAASAFLQR
jgi:hypothetical protein